MAGRRRLGLIGTGWIAEIHLAALERLARTELVGVVSSTPGRAETLVGQWGGRPYQSLDSMLHHQRPDVVLVCQPPHRAASACLTLIERGIPFLTEKPLAATPAEAEAVGAALQTRPVLAAVGYQWRALDFLPLVRERLDARPCRLVIGRWTGGLPGPSWWRHVAESGGQIVEQATHLYDLARSLVGEAEVIAATSAHTPRPDVPDADVDTTATAILRFQAGTIGTFTNSWIGPSGQVALALVADRARTIVRMPPGRPRPAWELIVDDGGEAITIPTERDPYEIQDERFLDALERGAPDLPFSTYRDALDTDRLVRRVVTATGSAG
jgi:myo-inositol 2-dehydrogenase / D-chiro-inositol 1-dehydrogenase